MLTISAPIVTERLTLRPFAGDDLDDLHAMHSRSDVTPYLYWVARTWDEVRAVLERRLTQDRLTYDGDTLALAMALREAGHVIGEITLRWASREHRQGELGFLVHPDVQGRGYAHEAATAVLDVAFRGLGLHRVFGRTDARNIASAALMRRLGMRQEAHFVHNEIYNGEWGDELVFAILAHEWTIAPDPTRLVQDRA